MSEILATERSAIIENIFGYGILPANILGLKGFSHFRSTDSRVNTFVEGLCLFPDVFSQDRTDDLYRGGCGLFPVLGERNNRVSATRSELIRRMSSSMNAHRASRA